MTTEPKSRRPTAIIDEVERYLGTLRGKPATELRAIYQRDYHTCDCPMPYVERKWNEALGTFTEIRLCCMARAVEDLTGLKLFEVFDFPPLWEWYCEEEVQQPDGTFAARGCPPQFLLQRMKRKGIRVRHGERYH